SALLSACQVQITCPGDPTSACGLCTKRLANRRRRFASSPGIRLAIFPFVRGGTVMQKNALLVLAVLALVVGPPGGYAQGPQSLTMTKAVVVSVDPSQRLMVIKNAEGRQQTVELDDQLAGFAGIRAGDEVVISLRKGPGRDRVMAISKGGTVRSATRTTAPPVKEETRAASARRPDERVIAPSTEAAEVRRNDAVLATYSDRVA